MRILLFLICTWFTGHPYYVSVADLKHNAAEKKIEGSIKLFVHDFEQELRRLGHKKIDLINVKDTGATEQIVSNYMVEHFRLSVNGESKQLTLIGTEQEAEHFWAHVSFAGCEKPRTVRIQNTILYDLLKEQVNIIHLESGGKTQSIKLSNPERLVTFTLSP
jgi:hypothetical protein